MAATREQLISDWRQELAAAEEFVATSPRLAWLARMKVRLYRFLLACYGRNDWQPPNAIQQSDTQRQSAQLVFDSAQAASLEGKPAKSENEIRSVLTSVAKAQDDAHAPGPLAGGLDYDSWVVVAAASSKLKTGRCLELLRVAGLNPRLSYRGDDQMVEVPAHQRHEAFAVVERNREKIHQPPRYPRTERIPLWCRLGAGGIVALVTTANLAWLLVAVVWLNNGGSSQRDQPLISFLGKEDLYAIWGSLFLIALPFIWLAARRDARRIPAAKRNVK